MKIIRDLLDLVYPPLCVSCGEKMHGHGNFFICAACAKKIPYIEKPVCGACGLPASRGRHANCAGEEYSFTFARSACMYGGPAAEAIKMFKYGRCLWLSKTLGSILREGIAVFPELREADIIAPVPLSRAREKERGFNQSELLARLAGSLLEKQVSVKNLVRIKNSRPQTELSGDSRRNNVSGIFRVRNTGEFRKKNVLLVDDVFTTGSTAGECSRELLSSGAGEVRVLTLARRA